MNEKLATTWEHFDELRKTIFNCCGFLAAGIFLSFFFYQTIFDFLLNPLRESSFDHKLILLNPLEGMIASIKICFWTGFVFSMPFWTYQLLRFIMPALYTHEIRYVAPFLFVSILFLFGGFLFAYTVSIPLSNQYLLSFNSGIGTNLWSLSSYLSYSIAFLLAHCIAFEICAVLLFLVHFQIITAKAMTEKRRHVTVVAFILGAILTPPDVVTQVILSTILLVIYELTILYGRLRRKENICNQLQCKCLGSE